MKKIFRGRKYDTDTAQLCGEYEPIADQGDFHYYYEQLYQKRTGEYFLYGCGNGLSPYTTSTGSNSWTGGEAIRPLTEEEAREWAEAHLDADEYERLFTVPEEEAREKKTYSFSLDGEAAAILTSLAVSKGESRSQVLCDLIKSAKKA